MSIQDAYEKAFFGKGNISSGIEAMEVLSELSGIKPTIDNLSKWYLKAIQKHPSTGDFTSLDELAKKYSLLKHIDKTVIQEIAKKQLVEGRLYAANDTYKHTKIKPNLTKEEIAQAFTKARKKGMHESHIHEFEQLTKQKEDPKQKYEYVQKRHLELLKYTNIRDSKQLSASTNIEPNLPKKKVVKIQNSNLEKNNFSCIEKIKNYTGQLPSKVIIQKKYGEYLKEENYNYMNILQNITGISPEEKSIQEKYKQLILEDEYINSLISITNIKPKIPLVIKNQAFERKFSTYPTYGIERLVETIGLPSQECIQEGYELYINNSRFVEMKEVQKITKIPLSENNKKLLEKKIKEI